MKRFDPKIDLRIWLPRLAIMGAVLAAYFLLFRFGLLPLNPFEWLFALGDRLRDELPKYGPLAPIVYVLLYAGQIVIAPLPGAALAYAAGFVFGPIAAVYSMLGILIGGAIGFILGRKLGWPLVERLAPRSWVERWRSLSLVNSSFVWFLLMLAPTPDIFYFIAGLTTLSFRRYIVIVLLGRTPGIILSTVLGANFEAFGAQWVIILIGAMLLVSLAGNWIRQRVEKRALNAAQNVETE